jgi:hypothetical protein
MDKGPPNPGNEDNYRKLQTRYWREEVQFREEYGRERRRQASRGFNLAFALVIVAVLLLFGAAYTFHKISNHPYDVAAGFPPIKGNKTERERSNPSSDRASQINKSTKSQSIPEVVDVPKKPFGNQHGKKQEEINKQRKVTPAAMKKPICPNCGGNKYVSTSGMKNPGSQRYYCRRCRQLFLASRN